MSMALHLGSMLHNLLLLLHGANLPYMHAARSSCILAEQLCFAARRTLHLPLFRVRSGLTLSVTCLCELFLHTEL